jgi:hypothetical protein
MHQTDEIVPISSGFAPSVKKAWLAGVLERCKLHSRLMEEIVEELFPRLCQCSTVLRESFFNKTIDHFPRYSHEHVKHTRWYKKK